MLYVSHKNAVISSLFSYRITSELCLTNLHVSRAILALFFHTPATSSWISNETIWCSHFQSSSSLSAVWILCLPSGDKKKNALSARGLKYCAFFSFKIKASSLHFISLAQSKNHIAILIKQLKSKYRVKLWIRSTALKFLLPLSSWLRPFVCTHGATG